MENTPYRLAIHATCCLTGDDIAVRSLTAWDRGSYAGYNMFPTMIWEKYMTTAKKPNKEKMLIQKRLSFTLYMFVTLFS